MKIGQKSLLIASIILGISIGSVAQNERQSDENLAINHSIDRALIFLQDDSHTLDYGSYAIMTYLNRMSKTPLAFNFDAGMERVVDTYLGKEKEYLFFTRLVGEHANCPTWQDIKSLDSRIDSTTLQALWSDKLKPSKKDYYAWLMVLSKEGGFELTHALVAIKWLEETGFADVQSDKEFAKTKSHLIAEIRSKILAKVDFWGDVEIEAVAFLLYTGEYSSVKPEWIRQILKHQRPDGGWAVDQERPVSVPHPTSLAVWALKQYSMGPSACEPWIQLERK